MLRGFDVSHHQGAENWADMKARFGLTWGACKATEGEGFRDDQFAANWRGMKAAGLVRMAYHFARPDSDPRDDAANFLAYVESAGAVQPTDVMVMDMEGNPGNLPLLQVRDWLAGWADEVTRETGRKPFLYCGAGYIANNATRDLQPHYAEWWYPRYPTRYADQAVWPAEFNPILPSPRNWTGLPAIWQFSSTFPVAGEEHDANVCRLTLDQLKTSGVQADAPEPKEPDMTTYIIPVDDTPTSTGVRLLWSPEAGARKATGFEKTLADDVPGVKWYAELGLGDSVTPAEAEALLSSGPLDEIEAAKKSILTAVSSLAVGGLTDEALAAIAKAVNDEEARRQAS